MYVKSLVCTVSSASTINVYIYLSLRATAVPSTIENHDVDNGTQGSIWCRKQPLFISLNVFNVEIMSRRLKKLMTNDDFYWLVSDGIGIVQPDWPPPDATTISNHIREAYARAYARYTCGL